VKIQNQPSAVFLAGSCAAKDPRKLGAYDLDMYASTRARPHTTMLRYHSRRIPTQADCAGENYTRFKNPAADTAIGRRGLDARPREAQKDFLRYALKALKRRVRDHLAYDRANIDARVKRAPGLEPNVWRRFTWNMES